MPIVYNLYTREQSQFVHNVNTGAASACDMDKSRGDRLRKAREARFRTVADFLSEARRRRVRINKNTYYKHERSERNPTEKVWTLYSEMLGVSVRWLLYGEGAAAEPLPERVSAAAVRLFLTMLVERYADAVVAAEAEIRIHRESQIIAAQFNATADLDDPPGRIRRLSSALQSSVEDILQSLRQSPAPPDDLARCAALFPSLLQVLPPPPR